MEQRIVEIHPMNPEPPPIADPHSTALVKQRQPSASVEIFKAIVCFCGALLLSVSGALVIGEDLISSRHTPEGFAFDAAIWIVALSFWIALFRIIKRNLRRKTRPS